MIKPLRKQLAGAATFALFLVALYILRLLPLKPRLKVIPYVASFFCRVLLRALDVKVIVIGKPPIEPCLVVANHLSYLDICVLATTYRSLYVTSLEMRRSVGVGEMIKLTHCHTVDRTNLSTLLLDIKEMSILLGEGHSLTLFPEATTSDGHILPFKPALLTTAAHAGVPVQPVAIRYLGLDNKTKDSVYYYGEDMEILPHLFSLSKMPTLHVEVEFLEPVQHTGSRKSFAHMLQQKIAAKTLVF